MNKIYIGSLRKGSEKFNALNIKCDRSTPLGNPYHITTMGRDECIKAYADNWDNMIKQPKQLGYFRMLKKAHKEGDIALMCWCKPHACHCDVIKSKLEE